MTKPDLDRLTTEARNARTTQLDELSTLDMLAVMNDEDRQVAEVVRGQLGAIARLVDAASDRMRRGGRIVYCGAGTSGRLGVLDAVECPPTFSVDPGVVVGLIAGGPPAFVKAVEGAEDSLTLGAADLDAIGLRAVDTVVGIAASGRTPYVLGALEYARAKGALTAAVVCNAGSPVAAAAELPIEVVTGPEVLTGSTRLKAGTATKLVLNMVTTGCFVKLHKVHGNLMVDVMATNEKLVARSRRIVAQATHCSLDEAEAKLAACGGEVKTAIVCLLAGLEPAAARERLQAAHGSVRRAVGGA